VHHWLVREAAVLVATDRDHASNPIVLRYDQVALFRREYCSSREETFVSEAAKPLRSGRYRPKECGVHCQAFRLAQPRLDSNPPLIYSFLTERQAAGLSSNLAASAVVEAHTARARACALAQEINQKLLLALDAIFSAVRPETTELSIFVEARHKVVRHCRIAS
jgi:hypothetical protein